MKIQNYLKANYSNKRTRRKIVQNFALYGCLLFVLTVVIVIRFSNANVGVKSSRLEFNWSPLLYLLPMTVISVFLSVMFLKIFDELYVCKSHIHRVRLAGLLKIKKFEEALDLITKSSDMVIRKYSRELIKAIKSHGENRIKVKDVDICNTYWGYGRAGLISIGVLFTFVGVYRVMINLGKSSQPVLQDLFSGAGEALSSTIVGGGFGCIVLIYFLTLTMMKSRMIAIEQAFFNNIGLEVD
jgi:hypothetical protein